MKTYAYTVNPDTFAYTIYADGIPQIYQPFPAGVEGTAPFASAEVAAAEAASVIATLTTGAT